MKIIIETVDHQLQRYPTCGDYFYDEEGILHIKVSSLNDEYEETLIAIHELIEERLIKKAGITIEEIDNFDIMYEKEREQGLHKDDDEPGFDERAPYKKHHLISTGFEMVLAGILGVDWNEYSNKVNSL